MVSVIIPVYNTELYLDECIRSVISQTYQELEILLINDGSTDRSAEICRKWEALDSRIRYMEKENEGQGRTRNLGISLAAGEYILFVDSDDYLDETLVDRVYQRITMQQAEICVFAHYGVDEKGILDECLLSFQIAMADSVKNNPEILGQMMPVLWDKMFSASLIKNSDIRMSNRICEDLVFNAQLYAKAKRICMLDIPLYYYRYKRSGNLSTSYGRYLEVGESIYELNRIFTREGMFAEYWMQLYDIAVTMFKDILFRIHRRTDLDVPPEIKSRYPAFCKTYKDCLTGWFSPYLDMELQEKKYLLVGSYNLRVILHRFLLEEDFLKEDYGSSSLISLMSEEPEEGGLMEKCRFHNAYRKRCVEQDIGKYFCKRAGLQEMDYIIIDLLDEILDLIQIREGCYITDSAFLQEAEGICLRNDVRIPFLCKQRRALFQKYAGRFAEKIRTAHLSVVIIENRLCEKHSGFYDVFTEYENLQEIRSINQELEWCYQYLRECLPDAVVVDPSRYPEFIFTQESFPFGCEPFYYNNGYYQRAAIQMNQEIAAREKETDKGEAQKDV